MMPHSRHSVKIVNERVNYNQAENADTIFCLNVACWNILKRRWGSRQAQRLVKDKNFIIGAGSQKTVNKLMPHLKRTPFNCIGVPSQRTANYLLRQKPDAQVAVLRNAVDPEVYKPYEAPTDFVVGWAGNPREEKRLHLLKKLSIPIKRAVGFKHEKMPAFYNSLSAYVCLSRTEGGPMPVLEAAAAGLPVVSTRVGIVPELLEEDWIVTTQPGKEAIRQTNEKLDILRSDDKLRRRVGERNRHEVLKHWTCEKRVKDWDKAYEGEWEDTCL